MVAGGVNTSQAAFLPEEALRIDEASLLTYLQKATPEAVGDASSLRARKFSHGQSNPTYLIEVGSRRYVLRKKPPGKLLASAHAVDREHRVQAALADLVPVPRMLSLCMDESVIGTPFYVMEHIEGRVFVDPALPGLSPDQRSRVYRSMASTLASLHSIDPFKAELEGFGRPENYCKRQVKRWWGQYLKGLPPGENAMPEMSRLATYLMDNIPPLDAAPSHPCIAHGDFRLDNLVFRCSQGPSNTEVVEGVAAVLDWELSTLGDPLADLAYCCQGYYLPSSIAVLPALPRRSNGSIDLPLGIPTEEEFLSTYFAARGISTVPPRLWVFYVALALFRMAAILAGVHSRALSGNASSSHALELAGHDVVRALAACALRRISDAHDAPLSDELVFAETGEQAVSADHGGSGFGPSPRVRALKEKLMAFMSDHVYPAEKILFAHSKGDCRWTIHPLMERLKLEAQAVGLWNLWMPADTAALLVPLGLRRGILGAGLSNLEYSHLSRIMGTCVWASEVFNCSAPDTGNMETLARYGTPQQQKEWLVPLLEGHIRSCFAMTEPAVASSDATNIQSSIKRDNDQHYVLNGSKWWTSGAMDPRCKVAIFMGKTDPSAAAHAQQSMVLVPMDAPGVRIVRALDVFGYDDAPHGHAEVHFTDVRVPISNCLLGEGRGFEIAQGRLGPGRLHHCMRLIGMGDRALQAMAQRGLSRTAFGKPLAQHGAFAITLAERSVELDAAALLVQSAANELDDHGNKKARGSIAAAKVAAPKAALACLDAAIQAHGGGGVSDDFPLAYLWANARTLRIADGPDEVHLLTIAKLRLKRASKL